LNGILLACQALLDSTVCAYLAVRAVGPQNIFGLIMPFKDYDQEGVQLAEEICRLLGISFEKIDISLQVEAYFSRHPAEQPVLRGNKMARERMSILYDYSARLKAMILGTSNKSELLIGYGTIHGDLACGINPMGDLYKTQVRQLARYLGVPEKFSAGNQLLASGLARLTRMRLALTMKNWIRSFLNW